MQIEIHSGATQPGVVRATVSFSYATCRWESDETLMRHTKPQYCKHYSLVLPLSSFPLSTTLSPSSSISLTPPSATPFAHEYAIYARPVSASHRNAISHSAKLKANLLAVCRKFSSCFPP